jgi:hypothetical protein
MHKTLHGDRATARIVGVDRRGRPEGAIVDVLERANREVVGRVHEERGIWYLVAENKRISQDILIPPDMRGSARPGQVVVAEVIEQPSAHREALAKVIEVLGNYTDPGMEIEIALRKHDLPYRFSAAAQRQAGRFPHEVQNADRKGRTDLTALPLVTIDGETARDFDDAVYCERGAKGFRLIVAIADVSHYVADGDALDGDARDRGTSVYFPRRVIPMLPEQLSNELCSLKPAVDRLCMACEMTISADGEIESYKFFPALMHSRARLTYNQVWDWLSQPKARAREAAAVLPHLENLYALYKVLASARARRGAIDFETIELELKFDAQGKIETIVPVMRNDAHKLIEECMLAANVCAASYLLERKQPALYRVHEGPTPEKLAALKEFLAGSACRSAGRVSDAGRLCEAAGRDQGSARFQPASDSAAALCSRRSTAPITRATSVSVTTHIRIHFADPPLSGSADPSLHQGLPLRHALSADRRGLVGARRALLADRASRRRCDPGRRELAQMLFHAGQGRRDIHGHRQRRHAFRPVRHARRPQRRRAGACDRARQRLLPLRRCAPRDERRAQRQGLPAGRPHHGESRPG